MDNLIRPTIGRQVWFWESGNLHRLHDGTPHGVIPKFQPEAATVVRVWGDRMINVQVIDCNGSARSQCSVALQQPGDEIPEGPHCSWMGYQIGQARAQKAIE